MMAVAVEPAAGIAESAGLSTYRLFGLGVRSTFDLPDLHPAAIAGEDVLIRLGKVPPYRGSGTEPLGVYVGDGGSAALNIAGVARYLITDGTEIVVDPHPDATARNVRLYLLGSAFAAILHQRGLFPLHANAIEIDGRAIAFAGHPGAGKSTIASWFYDRGARLLSDDVCVVSFDASGQPIVQNGIPRLRLWRDALERSGRRAEDHPRSFDDDDKYDVGTPPTGTGNPLPLDCIYLLETGGSPDAPIITPITGMQAVAVLAANTYRGGYLPILGGTKQNLAMCVRLSKTVGVFRLERHWGHDAFDAQLGSVAAHARDHLHRSIGA